MDLTTTEANFCGEWLRQNVMEKPKDDLSLTWFIPAALLYVSYARAASLHRICVYDMGGLWVALRLLFPGITSGKVQKENMFFGVRLIDKDPDAIS